MSSWLLEASESPSFASWTVTDRVLKSLLEEEATPMPGACDWLQYQGSDWPRVGRSPVPDARRVCVCDLCHHTYVLHICPRVWVHGPAWLCLFLVHMAACPACMCRSRCVCGTSTCDTPGTSITSHLHSGFRGAGVPEVPGVQEGLPWAEPVTGVWPVCVTDMGGQGCPLVSGILALSLLSVASVFVVCCFRS